MNKMTIRFPALAIALILAVVTAFGVACGSGENKNEQAPQPTTADEPAQEGASDVETSVASTLVAIDSIDSAGFHDMAEDLAQATEINPRYADKVANVLTVVGATVWPDDVQTQLAAMSGDLTALKTALDAGDLEGAQTASEAIHDSQHEFSKAVYAWIGGESGALASASDHASMISVMAAEDIIDSAGFHDMAEDLAQATEINPRYAGKVGNVLAAMNAAAWPADTQANVDTFRGDLTALKTALDANDLEAAQTAVEAVHDSQHELSKGTFAWLGGQHMSHDDMSEPLVAACMLKAQDLIDATGFHGIAEDLAEATEINPRYAGKIGNALAVVNSMDWPTAVSSEVATVKTDLQAFQSALDANDLEGARAASEAIHDSQHELSKALYAWLATQAV